MLAGAVFLIVAAAVFFVLVGAVFLVVAAALFFVLVGAVFLVVAAALFFVLAVAVFFAFIPMPSWCPALLTYSTARANFRHDGSPEGPLTWHVEAPECGRASPAWGEVSCGAAE
jgi:hypothetical protein